MISQFCSQTGLVGKMHEAWSDDTSWLLSLLLQGMPLVTLTSPLHVERSVARSSRISLLFYPSAWLRAEERESPFQLLQGTSPFPARPVPPTTLAFTTQAQMRHKCLRLNTTLKIFTLGMKVIYFSETVQNGKNNSAHHKQLRVRT